MAGDFLVLNGEDRVTQVVRFAGEERRCYWFSGTKAVRHGAFVQG